MASSSSNPATATAIHSSSSSTATTTTTTGLVEHPPISNANTTVGLSILAPQESLIAASSTRGVDATQEHAAGASGSSSTAQQQQQQQQPAPRRSWRRRAGAWNTNNHNSKDPIIAPGFGTRKDLERLAAQLSAGNEEIALTVEAVEHMMKTRGRGVRNSSDNAAVPTSRSRRAGGGGGDGRANAAAATDSTSAAASSSNSAWADFMNEEGVADLYGNAAVAASSTTASRSNLQEDADADGTRDATGQNQYQPQRTYILPIPNRHVLRNADAPSKKKAKKGDEGKDSTILSSGILVQAGSLDSSMVGRSKMSNPSAASSGAVPAYHCMVPTRILTGIKIARVFTSCNAVHSIAVDEFGTAYGWGRNEAGQLSPDLPENIALPTALDPVAGGPIKAAALGKSHTIVQCSDDSLWAIGANKSGQCGVRTSVDVPNFRKCIVPEGVTIVQIACGEDFSVALSSEGHIYSTGSSEYGQLGNGETGEYFIAANKLGFANESVFTRRTTFCHAPAEKLHTSSGEKIKVVPLDHEDVRIQSISCGKHHALALEAPSDRQPRVFSWGCGGYGCLGHGIQSDEYLPREIGLFKTIVFSGGTGPFRVMAGAHCSLLQTPNGHVYYWGKHRSVGEATMRPQLVDALANNRHVVTHCAAGGQTVVCATSNAQTVAWGQGPHGELGLGKTKSSSKPTFVEALNGVRVADLSCGYGHTLFVVRDDDDEDKAAVKKLPDLSANDIENLQTASESKGSKKRP